MIITYNDTKKDLPVEQLYYLFFSVGWAGKDINAAPDMLKNINIPFINSTLFPKHRVVSSNRETYISLL